MLTTFIYHTSFKSDLQIDVKHLHNNAEEKVGHKCNWQIYSKGQSNLNSLMRCNRKTDFFKKIEIIETMWCYEINIKPYYTVRLLCFNPF